MSTREKVQSTKISASTLHIFDLPDLSKGNTFPQLLGRPTSNFDVDLVSLYNSSSITSGDFTVC